MTATRGLVRPMVRPLVRAGGLIHTPEIEDGIEYDATIWPEVGGRMLLKPVGAPLQVGKLTDFFTFTGDALSKYRGSNGLLRSSVANTPRIEYDLAGNVLGLLIEGARTNLALRSQEFDNASWSKSAATISADAVAAPDGTTTADKIQEDNTNAGHFAQQFYAGFTNATSYTLSVWLKAAERSWAIIQLPSAAFGPSVWAYFDLANGVVGTVGSGAPTTKIERYSNGWWRVSISKAASATSGGNFPIQAALADNNSSYIGTTGSGIYAWGAQLEAASFPSSYIPTTTASMTRAADTASRTFGAEFTQNVAGTVVIEFDVIFTPSASSGFRALFAVDNNGYLGYINNNNNQYQMFDGTNAITSNTVTINPNTFYRGAGAYNASGMSAVLNGGTPGTGSFDTTMGAGSTINIGQRNSAGDPLFGHIRRLDYFPERKSDAFLKQKTAA